MKLTKKHGLSATVLKAMSVFGGVQIISILCSIVRTKLVAIWIGAAGVGIFGLFNSAIEMLSSILHLGIRSSAVRDIASEEPALRPRIITVMRRWSWILGLLSAVITLAISPLLSQWTFGDDRHTWGFIALSVVLLLNSITGGETAILQGLERLKRIAKASVWGIIAGLTISIPMFYYWRIDSIVPSILVYSIVTTVFTFIYREREVRGACDVSTKETFEKGGSFILLGVYMTISAFSAMLVSYIFLAYLNQTADTYTVGYYQAGYTLVNKYVGLVFAAIGMEFYPRLARVSNQPKRLSAFVSHEMTISLWILLPIIAIFIAADDIIVNLLYSSEFLVIIPFISWAIVGTVFRTVSWCMAFVILARGDGKIYLLTEISSAVIGLALNILLYEAWGMLGLGIACIVWYIAYTIITAAVYHIRYKLSLGAGMKRLIAFSSAISLSAALASAFIGWWAAAIVALVAAVFSARRLKKLL